MDNIQIDGKNFKLFLTREQIEKRIKELAKKVQKDYEDKDPLFIVVLNGAFMFASEFFHSYTDLCQIEFVKLLSYVGKESSGEVINCIGITDEMIKGRDVIILEDIVDSGCTMDYFRDYVQNLNAGSVAIVSLLFKPQNLIRDVDLNYYGFSIGPEFVIGYGLDYNFRGRNLTNIYQIVNP